MNSLGKKLIPFKYNDNILLLLFFLSGFTSLSYELVWIRELSVVFGKTILAISIIVAVYMAGLGPGSILFQRFHQDQSDYQGVDNLYCDSDASDLFGRIMGYEFPIYAGIGMEIRLRHLLDCNCSCHPGYDRLF